MIRFNFTAGGADRFGKRAVTLNPHLCSLAFLGLLGVNTLQGGNPPGDT